MFGLETEYGITIQGAASVDVVAESIELVRSYTEHGAHMKWDYRLEDPHRDARGFRAARIAPGHRRIRLLRDRPQPAAQFRGNQKRSRSLEWRALLQRSRSSGIFDAGMHDAAAARGPRKSGRAHSGGMRAAAKPEAARWPGSALVQEQHRLRRPQLRLPRQLSHAARSAVGPARRGRPALSDHAPNLRRRGQDGHRSRERGRAAGRFSDFAAGRFLHDAGEHRHDEQAAAREHAR